MTRYGAIFFKFDGIAGGAIAAGAPPEYFMDVMGLVKLSQRLREIKVHCLNIILTDPSNNILRIKFSST